MRFRISIIFNFVVAALAALLLVEKIMVYGLDIFFIPSIVIENVFLLIPFILSILFNLLSMLMCASPKWTLFKGAEIKAFKEYINKNITPGMTSEECKDLLRKRNSEIGRFPYYVDFNGSYSGFWAYFSVELYQRKINKLDKIFVWGVFALHSLVLVCYSFAFNPLISYLADYINGQGLIILSVIIQLLSNVLAPVIATGIYIYSMYFLWCNLLFDDVKTITHNECFRYCEYCKKIVEVFLNKGSTHQAADFTSSQARRHTYYKDRTIGTIESEYSTTTIKETVADYTLYTATGYTIHHLECPYCGKTHTEKQGHEEELVVKH